MADITSVSAVDDELEVPATWTTEGLVPCTYTPSSSSLSLWFTGPRYVRLGCAPSRTLRSCLYCVQKCRARPSPASVVDNRHALTRPTPKRTFQANVHLSTSRTPGAFKTDRNCEDRLEPRRLAPLTSDGQEKCSGNTANERTRDARSANVPFETVHAPPHRR